MRLKTFITLLILILIIAWFTLFFSSRAVLVHSEGPVQKADQPVEVLICTYFTGTGVLKKEYWHTTAGPIGAILNGVVMHSVCPRLIKL